MADSTALSPTRLLLVRHGETLANREFRYIGSRDDALSARGVQQAQQLAQAFTPIALSAVYSSPLQRAYQTALPLATQQQLPVQVLADLTEGRFGAWEGLSRAEVLAQDRSQLLAWEQDPTLTPPGGESFAAVQVRVVAAVERLAVLHPGQTIVLVSHVGPIKTLLCHALRAPLCSIFSIFIDPATISAIDWKNRPMVRLVNGQPYSGWEQARWLQQLI